MMITERIKQGFYAKLILDYTEHLLPVVPMDKFKEPLLDFYNFIKFAVEIKSNNYTPIEQNTVNRIVCSLPTKYQTSPLIEDLINVSKYIHNDTFEISTNLILIL
jgi:hypothetical protein